MPTTRQRVWSQCSVCGRVNHVRKDFLQKISYPYRCMHCPRKRPIGTLEDRMRRSLAHRKYSLREDFFETINTQQKAYWLGFLSGDGSITENKVRLCLNMKDKKHVLKFKKAVDWGGKDYYHSNDAIEVYFRSFKMFADLANYNVTPRKTFTIRFPDIPKLFEPHFIRGVFDADGCINREKRTSIGKKGQRYIYYGGEFCIEGNKQFILVLRKRFIELGLPLTSINYSGKKINRVRYGGINQLKSIYQYLYRDANVFLERKKDLFESIINDYHSEIIY